MNVYEVLYLEILDKIFGIAKTTQIVLKKELGISNNIFKNFYWMKLPADW